jgi:Protein of unknown function (DUF1579)
MRTFVLMAGVAFTCWLAGARSVAPQGSEEASWMPAKPAPEHTMLMKRVGTWDADTKVYMGPQPTMSKATMTYERVGDFWVVGHYKGDMGGVPFTGIELSGYDPEHEEFVSYWVDGGSPEMSATHGTWNAGTKTMTMTSRKTELDPMTGKQAKMVNETVVKDDDTLVFTMRFEDSQQPMMEINYKRRK